MNSIADIFDNSKPLLDGITHFFDKYIGCDLLRKCGIRKLVDAFTECRDYEYIDNPILRLIGDVKTSKVLPKCVSAKKLLTVNVMNLHEVARTNAGDLACCIGKPKKTHENIEKRKAFTLTLANEALMKEIDYLGTVSGYKVPDKFERTGLKAEKS